METSAICITMVEHTHNRHHRSTTSAVLPHTLHRTLVTLHWRRRQWYSAPRTDIAPRDPVYLVCAYMMR
jgi:hypothetical protein